MSISLGCSILLLDELLGMKSSRGEERTQKVSSFYQYKINIIMPDKCGIGKARN